MSSPRPPRPSRPLPTSSQRQTSCFPTSSRPPALCESSMTKLLDTFGIRKDFELFAARTLNLKASWTAGPLSEFLKFALGIWPMCDCNTCVEFGRSCKEPAGETVNQDPQVEIWGSAFKRCAEELKHFVSWRSDKAELRLDEKQAEQAIVKTLSDFKFFEDVDGRLQEDHLPKGYTKAWFLAQQEAATKLQQETAASKQSAPISGPAANAASNAVATKKTTPSSRIKGKSREYPLPSAVLSDCQRLKTCAESNAAKRTVLSMGTPLVDVMKELNRTVLRSATKNWLVIEFIEFASLIVQLNYAAAIYMQFSEDMEFQIKDQKSDILEESFRMVNRTRSSYIEAEERRSAGTQRNAEEREARRQEIQKECLNGVPDETEVRDGVQTVLFTFVWITDTAFQDPDTANSAIAFRLIPLLETVIVRCTRQAHLLYRARMALGALARMTGPAPPSAIKYELHLVELSMALQTLAGCNVALFTAVASHQSRRRKYKDRPPKISVKIKESVVFAPYNASIYCMAVADITLQVLKGMCLQIDNGKFQSGPPDCCKGEKCPSSESAIARRVQEMSRKLDLIEKTQMNWKPLLMPEPREKSAKKKKKKKDSSAAVEQDEGFFISKAYFVQIEEVLKKRVEQIEKANQANAKKMAKKEASKDKASPKATASSTPATTTVTASSSSAPANSVSQQTCRAPTPVKPATKPSANSAPTTAAEPLKPHAAPKPKPASPSGAPSGQNANPLYPLSCSLPPGYLEEIFADAPPALRAAVKESSLFKDPGKLPLKLRKIMGTAMAGFQTPGLGLNETTDLLRFLQETSGWGEGKYK